MMDCHHGLLRRKCHACCEADRDQLRIELATAREERDALAAHNIRLLRLRNQYDNSNAKPGDAIAELLAIIDETPETSLALREKEMKALGLEWSLMLSRAGARDMITRLRREAKEGTV